MNYKLLYTQMTRKLVLAFGLLLVFLSACTSQITKRFCTSEDILRQERLTEVKKDRYGRSACDLGENYIPDTNYIDQTPMKYIRLNIHWINTSDSSKNYVGKKAIKFTEGLLRAANRDVQKNCEMWLPNGNNTPVLPPRYQYVLTPRPNDPDDDGIYFHFDDEIAYYVHKGKNRNISDKRPYQRYGIQKDTVLNIFIMPHHPDSVASPTYHPGQVGVALGSHVKIAGMFEGKGTYWQYRGCFNHEVGHIYGLSHTWRFNDGCDDTPRHKQECWSPGQRPGCDTLTSNNVMDYNVLQNSWTPCQIGKVQYRMAKERSRQRKFLEPTWCTLKEDQHIFIKDSIQWDCMKDLEGHLTIEPGASLTMRCRTSLPKGAKITVMPGATLRLDNARLHNACGEEWEGIEIQETNKEKGQVVFIGDPVLENIRNPIN